MLTYRARRLTWIWQHPASRWNWEMLLVDVKCRKKFKGQPKWDVDWREVHDFNIGFGRKGYISIFCLPFPADYLEMFFPLLCQLARLSNGNSFHIQMTFSLNDFQISFEIKNSVDKKNWSRITLHNIFLNRRKPTGNHNFSTTSINHATVLISLLLSVTTVTTWHERNLSSFFVFGVKCFSVDNIGEFMSAPQKPHPFEWKIVRRVNLTIMTCFRYK